MGFVDCIMPSLFINSPESSQKFVRNVPNPDHFGVDRKCPEEKRLKSSRHASRKAYKPGHLTKAGEVL
jgi:hypothetical protein